MLAPILFLFALIAKFSSFTDAGPWSGTTARYIRKLFPFFFADCADEIFLCQKTLLALVSVQ